jgi:serine/threonine protein phosphatase PrpC
VFISYAWGDAEHQERVVALASRLRVDGIDAILDLWDLRPGQDKYHFMERMVGDPSIAFVLILCDARYAEKTNADRRGVHGEAPVITPELYASAKSTKFVPIAMERDENGQVYMPFYLQSRMYIDLSSEDPYREQYERLLRLLYGIPELLKPELGKMPAFLRPDANPEERLAMWLRPQGRGITVVNEHVCIGTRMGADRKENQDRAIVARFGNARSGSVDVFAVCDGMGGMVDGGACAERAIASFLLTLVRLMLGGRPLHSALLESVQEANRRIFDLYDARGGTTLVALVKHRDTVTAACVGDSRLMLVRTDGSSAQLSRDDTMRGALDAMGRVPVERTPEHDRLVQFVGMGRDLQPHVFPVVELEDCRFLMLTTDGAYRLGSELVSSVSKNAQFSKHVVERVLHMADWLGGADDATLVAVTGRSLQAAAHSAPDGLVRVWGPAQQQLVLGLQVDENRRLADQRSLEPPPSIPAARTERNSRSKKQPRSRKDRAQAALPLADSPDLIIDLGESSGSQPDVIAAPKPAPTTREGVNGSRPRRRHGGGS